MTRSRPTLSAEVRALLDRERVVPQVAASVRARALARARAALVAGRVTAPLGFGAPPRHRWGVTIALACAASAAVGATAYELGAYRHSAASNVVAASSAHVVTPPAASTPSAIAVPPPASAGDMPPATPAVAIVAEPPARPAAASKARSSLAEPSPDELRLLRQARAAVARRDFSAALSPIAEHARRFKDGRLAEEREALRVRALSGLGRMDDARHAADAFAARFPRSVLLPAVSKMPAPRP